MTTMYRIKIKYLKEHSNCELKVGDRVRFTKSWADFQTDNFLSSTSNLLASYLGKLATIIFKDEASYEVSFDNDKMGNIRIPYFCLEKLKYVPFTFENDLVGRVVKDDRRKYLIIEQTIDNWLYLGCNHYSFNTIELLKKFTFLDGSPCGKLI